MKLLISQNNANPKAIHICNSHEPTLDQKLQKSMSCQRTEEMKIAVNLKDKIMKDTECQCVINRLQTA